MIQHNGTPARHEDTSTARRFASAVECPFAGRIRSFFRGLLLALVVFFPLSTALDAAAADQIHIVSRWPGDVPEHYFWDGAQWQGWNVIGGKTIVSPPALVSYQGNVHLFAVADDQHLYQSVWNNSTWSDWLDFGGPFSADGAAAVDYFGLLVLVAATPDNQLLMTYFDPGTNQWQNYVSWATNVYRRPALTMHNGSLQVLVSGGDDSYYLMFTQGDSFSPFYNIGGPFAAGGAMASFGGQLNVFGPSYGGSLYHVGGDQLQNFVDLGAPVGTTVEGPAAALNFADSLLMVLLRTADNGLYERRFSNGSWSEYSVQFGQALVGPGATYHQTTGGPDGGVNHAPTLGSIMATRLVHSFGRDDALRFEGLLGRPGVGLLGPLLAPAIVTLTGAANPLVTAASALADCCTLIVAEGASDPDGNPVLFKWQAVTGTFYSTGSVGGGGFNFGDKIADISLYTRNSVFWEAPSIGFPVLHFDLMGGLTNVGVEVVDVPATGQPMSSGAQFVALEWDRTIHLELSAIAGRRLPNDDPEFPGGIQMKILPVVTGNSANLGVQPDATVRIECGNRKDTIVQMPFITGVPVDCPYEFDEENHNVTVRGVVTGGGGFISAIDGPKLDLYVSRGCTVGTTESIVVKNTSSQCNDQVFAGGDNAETHIVEMGTNAGSFDFDWQTYGIEDRVVVTYAGGTLFDSGCVGGSGTERLTFSGSSTAVTVQVFPNCNAGSGTAWDFTVHCPMSAGSASRAPIFHGVKRLERPQAR